MPNLNQVYSDELISDDDNGEVLSKASFERTKNI